MPQGIQVWDASGNLVYDTNSRAMKHIGVLSIGPSYTGSATSGSITNNAFLTGEGYVITPFDVLYQPSNVPVMTFSGNQLFWQFLGPPYDLSFRYGVM